MKKQYIFLAAIVGSAGSALASSAHAGVIWDNYSSGYNPDSGGSASQLDLVLPFDAQTADDFLFTTAQEVTGVDWIGFFFNGTPLTVPDWNIFFYGDNSGAPTGGPADPSATALASYSVGSGAVSLTDNGDNTFSYSTELTSIFAASANSTYWIAIQPIFEFEPQWAISGSLDQTGYTAKIGFPEVLFIPYWSESPLSSNEQGDMAFRLTGAEEVPTPATLALFGLGLAGLGWCKHHSKSAPICRILK
tara:strand:+ start:804 stop:1547 length:744 start_codon:yes stop_codon:yes gene_type:complete